MGRSHLMFSAGQGILRQGAGLAFSRDEWS